MIRYPKGASDLPLEVILSITNDPESEDITKKIDTMKVLSKVNSAKSATQHRRVIQWRNITAKSF